ncbi:MAG: hypothetical protein RLZZ453_235 [Chlamydiota bacterium]|jgi:hypothetical protein
MLISFLFTNQSAKEYAQTLIAKANNSGFVVGRFTAAGKFAKALKRVQKSPQEKGAVEEFYKAFYAVTKVITPSFDFSPTRRAAVLRFFRLDPAIIEQVGLMEAEQIGRSNEVSELSFSKIPSYLNKQSRLFRAFGPSIRHPLAERKYRVRLQTAFRNGLISKIGNGLPCERKVVEGFLGSSPEAAHVRDAEVAHALSVRMSALRELEKKIFSMEGRIVSPLYFAEVTTSQQIIESLMIKRLSGKGVSSLSRLVALLVNLKDPDEKRRIAPHLPKLQSLIRSFNEKGVLKVEDALQFLDEVKVLPVPLSKSDAINKAVSALKHEASGIEENLSEMQKLSRDIADAQEKRLTSLQEIKELKDKVSQENKFFALPAAEQEKITQRQLNAVYEARLAGIEAVDRYVNPIKLKTTQRAYAVGLFAIKALSLFAASVVTGTVAYNNSQKVQEMFSSMVPYIPDTVAKFFSPYTMEIVEKVTAVEERVWEFISSVYKRGITLDEEEPVTIRLWQQILLVSPVFAWLGWKDFNSN